MSDVQKTLYIVTKIYCATHPVVSKKEYDFIMSVSLDLPHLPEVKEKLIELRNQEIKNES